MDDRFAVDTARLRASVSTKWNKHGPDVLGAWVADMDFAVDTGIIDELQRYLTQGFFGYGVDSLKTRYVDAFANWWSRFGLVVDPDRCVITTEVVQAMHATAVAYTDPGDGILILTPVYPPFLKSVDEQQRSLVEHRLRAVDGRYVFDVDALRSQVARTRPKVFFLCHPHNPIGRAWTDEELFSLLAIAEEFDLVVISDEIHADLVFVPHTFRSFASLSEGASERTVTLTSTSKSFNIAGLRCAVMHFGSDALLAHFRRRLAGDILGVASVPGLLGSIAAWSHGEPWLKECLTVLDANRHAVFERLVRSGLGIDGPLVEATYLQWLDFSALPGVRRALELDPTMLVSTMIREHVGVALNDGPTFGNGLEACARLNFATSPEVLHEICERVATFARSMS